MKRTHLLAGAGTLSVFTIGAGFALAQQGVSPADAYPQGVDPLDTGFVESGLVDTGDVDSGLMETPVADPVTPIRGSTGRARADDGPTEGGPVLTFGISSTLSATDNYSLRPTNGDSAELFDTQLSFGYVNRRAIDELRFDMSGVLRAIEPPGANSRTFDSQRARLGYDREGVNSTFGFGLDYDLTSVDAIDPFENDRFFEDDPLDETDLTQDQGERQQIGARFSFETGLNDPIGFILTGRYRDRTYSGTTDPGLFDTQIYNLSGTTRLALSPVTETRLVLGYEDYSADDTALTDRRTTSASLGLTHALSSTDTFDISVGLQDIETDETILGTRRSETENGVIGSIGFSRELAAGSIGTTFDLNDSVNGQSATWLANRAWLLPRGSVELSLGVTSDVDDTIRPVGSVDFIHEMLRSTFSASLSRQVATSTQSNELRTTQVSLGYDYEINSISSIGFATDYAEIEQIGSIVPDDTRRTNLRATYSRSLTRDWQFSSGYEYRVREESGAGTATSNRVFLTLQRDFVIRP
ncbi:hypothetical protein ACEWPL_017895 [Roseovarius sp. S1116L3]|uniref:hypothetical protein n=1 Tax=Roseovarius roseus TaxID=3342636 RepID=UPI00372B168F